MKSIVCLMLGCSCTAIGVLKTWELWVRLLSLRDLIELLYFMKSRICFEQVELKEILEEASCKGPERYRNVCDRLSKQYSNPDWDRFSDLWTNIWNDIFSTTKQREEGEIWNRLGRQLGKGGPEQQVQAIQLCFQELDRLENQLHSEYQVKGKMYCSLGVCIGLFVTILLI